MSNDISKQEYLKRYMDSGKNSDRKRKKKTKLSNQAVSRLKIVDQDIDLKSLKFGDKADEEEDEDAPVVAEIIDERPLEVKVKELYESSRWKKIENNNNLTNDDNLRNELEMLTSTQSKISASLSPRNGLNISKRTRHDSDSDVSPPRNQNQRVKRRYDSDCDISPPRNKKSSSHKRYDSDSDVSPPRKQNSSLNRKHSDSDISLPRKQKSNASIRHDSDCDISPPRKQKSSTNLRHDSDSNISPPRKEKSSTNKKHYDSDISPPRKQKSNTNTRHDSDSDISPPRKQKANMDEKHNSGSDISLRNEKQNKIKSRYDSDSDIYSSHYQSKKDMVSKSKKPTETLSGLKAGLQNSSTLKQEVQDQKKREKTHIEMLDDKVSGKNAETIVRDRATGMKRDLEQERKKKEEENKKNEQKQQKYSEWGKGIEQVHSKKDKFEDDLYEMSKPLARYRDDEDLDEKLKSIIHEEDPMAEFIKKKRKKDTPTLPLYNGPPAPPNRFGIQPGYRWDGVDRSNGFEKRYFEKFNKTKAVQEEAYLWSVQNM